MNNLDELLLDCATRQKKGVHFIIASIFVWVAVMIVHLLDFPILTKNLLTFCCTTTLLPLSYLVSKMLKIDFAGRSNPLTKLGLLFSLNQFLYLLIAMLIYPTVPEKMLMVIAVIFAAHLLPYSWLYSSKSYVIVSIVASFIALGIGLNFDPFILAAVMIVVEILFSFALILENRKLRVQQR